MLQQLKTLFAGKRVHITDSNNGFTPKKTFEGICKTVHACPRADHFEIELENGQRWGIVPEKITANSVEGKIRSISNRRRKIQLI